MLACQTKQGMSNSGILVKSFEMLKESPEMFLPKILSSFIGSLWFIGFLLDIGPLYLYLVTAPLVAFLGFFVTVMLASMVKNSDSENKIILALRETLTVWKEVIASIIGLFVLMTVIQIPAILGVTFYIQGAGLAILVASVSISFAMFVAVVFLGFFYPISLIDHRGLKQGIKDSATVSLSNKREVSGITLFAFLLLGLAAIANSTLGQALGFTGFVLFRIVSAVISTYVYVVSPAYYLQASS